MCKYHLQGRCFHPKRAKKGVVAVDCQVHGCDHCTHKQWQQEKMAQDAEYYDRILKLMDKHEKAKLAAAQEKKSGILGLFAKKTSA